MTEKPFSPTTEAQPANVDRREANEMDMLKKTVAALQAEMATLKEMVAALQATVASNGETKRTPDIVSKAEFNEAVRTIEKTLTEINEVTEDFSTWASECANIAKEELAHIVATSGGYLSLVDASDVPNVVRDIITQAEDNLKRLRETKKDALEEPSTPLNLDLINKFHPDNLSPLLWQNLQNSLNHLFRRKVMTIKKEVLVTQANKLDLIRNRVHLNGLEKWFGCLDKLRVSRVNDEYSVKVMRERANRMPDGLYATGFDVDRSTNKDTADYDPPPTIRVGG